MSENLRTKLKKSWMGQRLTESQFEEYLSIYEKFPEEFTERDKIIAQINNNEFGSPEGSDGEHVMNFMYRLSNKTRKLSPEMIKIGSSLLADIQSGKLSQLELTPEGTLWVSRATLSYWLKRWDKLYHSILENLKFDPKAQVGKQIASEWIELTDKYFSMGPRSLMLGITAWQEMSRQKYELKEMKTLMSPQDLVKEWHVKLLFNSEAMSWIAQALAAYEN